MGLKIPHHWPIWDTGKFFTGFCSLINLSMMQLILHLSKKCIRIFLWYLWPLLSVSGKSIFVIIQVNFLCWFSAESFQFFDICHIEILYHTNLFFNALFSILEYWFHNEKFLSIFVYLVKNLHREIDPFSTELMQEDGFKSAAAPECKGQLGWVYRNGFCYMFSRYKADLFLEINF